MDAHESTSDTVTETVREKVNCLRVDRHNIETESTSIGDLAVLADSGVAVYNSTTLEQGILAQVPFSFFFGIACLFEPVAPLEWQMKFP